MTLRFAELRSAVGHAAVGASMAACLFAAPAVVAQAGEPPAAQTASDDSEDGSGDDAPVAESVDVVEESMDGEPRPAPPDGDGVPKPAPEATEAPAPPPSKAAEPDPVAAGLLPKCRPPGEELLEELPKKEEPKPAEPRPDLAPKLTDPQQSEHEAAVARYADAAADYQLEVKRLVEGDFQGRKVIVERGYDRRIGEAEVAERDRRTDAIARFEEFVGKYPDHPEHTPDVMFRLAELYYERSEVQYADASDQYDVDRDLYDRGRIPAEPTPPEKDYSDSARIYRDLIARFGSTYRYADAVYYLLGYVQEEAGNDAEARQVWTQLTQRYPKSDYAPEVHLRIGEMHFDYGEFQQAAASYNAALAYPDSSFYDKALYKLAWTHFQLWDYDRAIKTFKDLIAFYDGKGDEAGDLASALRDEAVEYLAKSLAEDDWDNDGLPDEDAGVSRALAYVPGTSRADLDILRVYADALFNLYDKDKFVEAVTVYQERIKRDPLALDAPEAQRQIIKAYDILRDTDKAAAARQVLAEMFSPGSPWAKANADNPKALRIATAEVEKAMREAALTHHARAQEIKAEALLNENPEQLEQALGYYAKAARAYESYLTDYPNEPRSYEIRFFLGETLYYSNQFGRAAAVYAEVARDPHHTDYREAAAWSTVKSLERILADKSDTGALDSKAVPGNGWSPPETEDGGEDEVVTIARVTPEPIPAELQSWLKASDLYLAFEFRNGGVDRDATLSYLVAEMYYRYKHFPEARDRFQQVMSCFMATEVAALAATNIINSYREENDFENLEKWVNLTVAMDIGDPETRAELVSKIKIFKLGNQFRKAEALYEAKDYLAAAKEFERLADENEGAKFADKAYYNAADAYKRVRYYDSASRIFEKLVTDPRYKNSSFAEESLFELAETYKQFFNYERAISAFERLYDEYPDGKNRPYALFQAAQLRESVGKSRQAATTYEKYAKVFGSRSDAAGALYRATTLYEELGDTKQEKRSLELFVQEHASTVGMDARVLQAKLRLANLENARGRERQAVKLWRQVVEEYDARAQLPGSDSAVAAAEARFRLVEIQFREYSAIELSGSATRQQRALANKVKLLGELEAAYSEVLPYKALDWVIAGSFRLGGIYDQFARTLFGAPEPEGLSDDELDMYLTLIEDEGLKYENVAIQRYETTVEQSRRLKVTNEWSKAALKAINRYKPAEYPLFKEEKRAVVDVPLYSDAPPTVPPPPGAAGGDG